MAEETQQASVQEQEAVAKGGVDANDLESFEASPSGVMTPEITVDGRVPEDPDPASALEGDVEVPEESGAANQEVATETPATAASPAMVSVPLGGTMGTVEVDQASAPIVQALSKSLNWAEQRLETLNLQIQHNENLPSNGSVEDAPPAVDTQKLGEKIMAVMEGDDPSKLGEVLRDTISELQPSADNSAEMAQLESQITALKSQLDSVATVNAPTLRLQSTREHLYDSLGVTYNDAACAEILPQAHRFYQELVTSGKVPADEESQKRVAARCLNRSALAYDRAQALSTQPSDAAPPTKSSRPVAAAVTSAPSTPEGSTTVDPSSANLGRRSRDANIVME